MAREKYNPQVRDVEIGIRNMKSVRIFPLSIADQLEFGKIIKEALAEFFNSAEADSDSAMAGFAIDLIEESLPRLLRFVLDEVEDEDPERLLKEITNLQASEIANIIYEENYLEPSKNLKGLFEKMKDIFQSERPLLQSVDIMEDTGSSISSDSPTEKED